MIEIREISRSVMNLMSQADHIAAFLLPVDMAQADQRKAAAFNQIAQHAAW